MIVDLIRSLLLIEYKKFTGLTPSEFKNRQ